MFWTGQGSGGRHDQWLWSPQKKKACHTMTVSGNTAHLSEYTCVWSNIMACLLQGVRTFISKKWEPDSKTGAWWCLIQQSVQDIILSHHKMCWFSQPDDWDLSASNYDKSSGWIVIITDADTLAAGRRENQLEIWFDHFSVHSHLSLCVCGKARDRCFK